MSNPNAVSFWFVKSNTSTPLRTSNDSFLIAHYCWFQNQTLIDSRILPQKQWVQNRNSKILFLCMPFLLETKVWREHHHCTLIHFALFLLPPATRQRKTTSKATGDAVVVTIQRLGFSWVIDQIGEGREDLLGRNGHWKELFVGTPSSCTHSYGI